MIEVVYEFEFGVKSGEHLIETSRLAVQNSPNSLGLDFTEMSRKVQGNRLVFQIPVDSSVSDSDRQKAADSVGQAVKNTLTNPKHVRTDLHADE